MVDYDLKLLAQERLADRYTPAELVELLGDRLTMWDIIEELWDFILDAPDILETIGINEDNDLS